MAAAPMPPRSPLARRWLNCLLALGLALAPMVSTHVTARRLLDEDCSWKTVVSAFEKQGLSENDALTQARVARILRAEDYNFKTHKPILWTPKL